MKDQPRLRELHAHVCGDDGGLRICDADESSPNEAEVCAAWDALRDAYRAGFLACRERAVAVAADLSPDNCMSPAAQPYWQGYDMAAHDAAGAILALEPDGEGR